MSAAGTPRRRAAQGPVGDDAEKDGCLGAVLRVSRHPLRMLTMGVAAFAAVSGVALDSGVTASVLGAASGVVLGEALGRSRYRLPVVLGGLAAGALAALVLAMGLTHLEFAVRAFGTGGALSTHGFIRYGAVALAGVAAMRATAKRRPNWMALELSAIVVAVTIALSAHRGGVIARPLWLSDFAWRRGMDPADILLAFGVAAALVSASLLLFERRGRLGLATLPLLPLIALLGVSCLDVSGVGPDLGEASPDSTEGEGEAPEDPPEGDPSDGDGDPSGRDGGTRPRDGGARRDGGGARDGGPADGGAGRGDGGLDGGAGRGDGGARDASASGAGRGDGGARDGGGAGVGGDGGLLDGGGAGSGSTDGGGGAAGPIDGGGASGVDAGGGAWSGWDAGLDDLELPPPQENPAQGEGESARPSQADLTDQPPPTGSAAASPAAVVLFENDYSPPSGYYYFRQDAWSHFNGARLVPTDLPGADRDIVRRFPSRSVDVAPPPDEGRTTVAGRVALLARLDNPFGLESTVRFTDSRNPNPARFTRAYSFVSRSLAMDYRDLFGRAVGDPAWSEQERQLYLQPHPDERWAEFAEQVVSEMPAGRQADPFARAVAIKLRLDETLTYSTAERHAEAEDSAVDFFFGNKIGYCVHFAHTAVYLWRAVGVPARVGVGFAAPEANRRGGSALMIRSGDAHAWPELYLTGVGWVVLDISAAENLDPPGAPADEDLQRLLGEMAREEPPAPEDEVSDEPRPKLPSAETLGKGALAVFLAILALLLVVLYAIKLARRLAPLLASDRGVTKASYRASLDRLAEVGLAREYGETREQFAKRAAELSPSFVGATTLLLDEHLGPPSAGPKATKRAWGEVRKRIRAEVNAGTPLWRRVLGVLHPASFLDAR